MRPIIFNTFSAIANAPPVFSRNAPIITPNTIISPILPKVPPNPSFIDTIISVKGIPAKIPYKMEIIKSAKNACILSLVVKIIIAITAKRR